MGMSHTIAAIAKRFSHLIGICGLGHVGIPYSQARIAVALPAGTRKYCYKYQYDMGAVFLEPCWRAMCYLPLQNPITEEVSAW